MGTGYRDRLPRNQRAARRREIVAQYRLRGLTLREISAKLQAEHMDLADRRELGVPFSLSTISRDVVKLEAQWLASSVAAVNEHKARILAEIQAAKKQGWENGDLHILAKAWARECAILGLDSPIKLASDKESPFTLVMNFGPKPE